MGQGARLCKGGPPVMGRAMRRFANFVAVDWSGARGRVHPGIAVAVVRGDGPPQLVEAPGGRGWSRAAAADWLGAFCGHQPDTLVGFDWSAGAPFADCGGYFPGFASDAADLPGLWALVEALCADDGDLGAAGLLAHAELRRHFRHGRGDVGDAFQPPMGRLRLVELHQRASGQAASASLFNLVGAAQVGKASLTGMRVLHRLRPAVPLWPLDGVPAAGPLLVEIYTSIAARAAGMPPGRSKIRDGKALDAALAALGSAPAGLTGRVSDHDSDALVTAAWLRLAAADAALWAPPTLTANPGVRRTEGWTFGIR